MEEITTVQNVPNDGSVVYTLSDGEDEFVEAILVQTPSDSIESYRNHCQHWTDVELDSGDGATKRDGEVVCMRHGARFETETGVCTVGPCEGAMLERVSITVEDGSVFLTDSNYEFEHTGPDESDDYSDMSTQPRFF